MRVIQDVKDRVLARLFTWVPWFSEQWAKKYAAKEFHDIPWTPLKKELSACRVAIVTTAGVHLKSQLPFDMEDRDGDPSYQAIPSSTLTEELMITHKYYDHSDADKDINIVFPIDRFRELKEEGYVGELASTYYSFMGHIDGPHIATLIEKTAPEVAIRLKGEKVDAVFLTPA
ncbi:MAG: hypothetical protein HY731_07235 [Candidatus Tectomicrobia bacterium]|nr:hypothetical protein [Candidatus Tectomicrobia bacterium]